ncbi:Ankyrin-1 [Geodia barretti]|uniref:Ankyrin-1 n=1 Tax=Geodia barretti TaxID=519541 RepID=A0AA35X233_GEOBA|nr:Ankyrin-1 [Geodia barretti]
MLRKFLRGGSRSSPPKITGQPQSVYDAVPGSSVCLLVLTDPKQSLSEQMQFQWHHCPFAVTKTDTTARNSWSPVESGGKDRITGINSSTLLLSEVRQSDRGSYRCQITNSSGTTLSRPATITIVSPPQIEAHPRDVVDVVTGTSATFSVNVVSAAGEEVRSGGEGEEGGGGRERVGSGTREDLQIMWEVLKTNSQLPAAMNEDIVNSGENGSESPGPETPHQRIFRQHHPDLRQYLNTSSILPYLSRHSLVTSDQLEELTLPVLTNTRKVDLLLSWLPRSTVDFLEKFVICLNEANDHLAHAELAGKLQTAMAESMRRGSEVIEASFPVSPVATLSPAPSSSDSGGGETVGGGGRWEEVREKEGRVEGATTANLQLLHVDKEQEGRYRCRVEYKGCTVFSQSASLSVLEDGEIVRRLLGHCRETEEGVADAAVDRFLEEHGNSSRLAKKALVAVLDSTSDPTSLLQSFTNRQVPVNFLHNGMYPLHYACVKGHWRAVQHLITCGASKTALTQQDGRNALHLVSMRGDNNSLQFLIHTGADQLINIQDKYGKTPLHLACEAAGKIAPGKHISQDMRDIKTVIQNLLKTKSSLRAQDKNGQTPLHLAARAGHPWVVEVFSSAISEGWTTGTTTVIPASTLPPR